MSELQRIPKSAKEAIVTQPADLEARIRSLEDIEALKRLKAKYWRCLDRKLWDEIAECFTEDAFADYGPQMRFEGRQAIVKFLKDSLGRESIISTHGGHNPEIEITGTASARATWALNDYIVIQPNTKRRGWGFYEDEYVKENNTWRIKTTKEANILEEWDTTKR